VLARSDDASSIRERLYRREDPTVGLNGRAIERAFAKAIRIYLEGHRGRPQLDQRPHDDLKGATSLFV
jgi:hypothetical protein